MKITYVDPPKGRKTIEFSELQRLSFCNSKKTPAVSIAGVRNEWVGIGWIECGPEKGDETVVVENGKMPVTKGKKKNAR